MGFFKQLEFNPTTMLEWLRRAFWWLVFGAVLVYLPFQLPVLTQPDRWVENGLRDLLVMLGWLTVCRVAAMRFPEAAVPVCLLGLLPISAVALTNPTEVTLQLDATPLARMLLPCAILLMLGLFARAWAVVTGVSLALATLGQGANTIQLVSAANVLLSVGIFGSLTRFLLDRLALAHAKLERNALTDALTGLSNRRALDADHARFVGGWLTIWDVDDLKRINDTLGHAAGDEHLLEFVRSLRAFLPSQACAYRTGGDEFVTLSPVTPEVFIENVRGRFLKVSVGSARAEADLHLTMLEADANLYEEKRQRKNVAEMAATIKPVA
jgi:GGDEF domain-containing protein